MKNALITVEKMEATSTFLHRFQRIKYGVAMEGSACQNRAIGIVKNKMDYHAPEGRVLAPYRIKLKETKIISRRPFDFLSYMFIIIN